MTTLAYSTTTIDLPDDLIWTDEYDWRAVEQQRSFSISGALHIDAGLRQAGRPITLTGGDNFGWLARGVLDSVFAAAQLPGQQFTLTLRGVAHTVQFDQSQPPVQARPVIEFNTPDATDYYAVTLRFVKV